jgi:hypothetical protein
VDHWEINTGETPIAAANVTPRPRSLSSHSDNFMLRLLANREVNAIALREFQIFANRYAIGEMKTISEIRRENLALLIGEHGSIAALNAKIGMARTDATLSQIRNQSPDSKTGVPKSMGDAVARRIETGLGLEVGWMDNPQIPHTYRTKRISTALAVMEAMDDDQLAKAVQIIDTLAQPAPQRKNGTDNRED